MQYPELQQEVAWACRILAMDGHGDLTLGHVSVRCPGDDLVYMKRNGRGLGEVTPDDVLAIDLQMRKVDGVGSVHLEAAMHTAVYRLRPDVCAVIHTHPPYATALGATTVKLEFLSHDAVLFPNGVSIFEETPELITSNDLGTAVAQALGKRDVLLLRNHGVLLAGKSVPWAVLRAITLERAVRIQAIAASLGPLRPIAPDQVLQMYPYKYRDEFVSTYWSYLIRQAKRAGYGDGM